MTSLYAGNDDLYDVRSTIEWLTNSSPYLSIDWPTYALVQSWCQHPDKLGIIVSTLTERLKSAAPSSFKAVILLQAIPSASLVPLIDALEPLAANTDNAYIALIAKSLLDAAKAEKSKAEEEDAKLKWEEWSGRFGRSAVGWLPLPEPREPEWGWYGMRWVPEQAWWQQQPEVKEEEG
ncbi:uncharacterized protein MKK02DRAFT_44393 [Dioszegia hungarica]|uniref:Uncharacterized protein n=1 Tax=Dioszegia hungarica TaxID=4972 RepID=A0AA38H7C4_9TREE|nr:uncharacterized protein MKK02DRAFT_44393 [Dioszegia hungarica]KAI9635695.1 hypothetical protein MKK02DRAFT_44393 [Dioszegia hungarica]